MNAASWLLFSAFAWLSGFFYGRAFEPGPYGKLVQVPRWLFMLLGGQRLKNIPPHVLPVRSVFLQIVGTTAALYGIFLDQRLIGDPDSSDLLGVALSLLVSLALCRWLYRKGPHPIQGDSSVDRPS